MTFESTPKEPVSIYSSAESMQKEHSDIPGLLFAFRKFIFDHANHVPPEKHREPQSIIESRFTSPDEAFEAGMHSCGAVSNITAAMLRHLGYKVKFVHGETDDSVDHAWISVWLPEQERWAEYDLTRQNLDVPETHDKKSEVDSWDEIKNQIYSDHETLQERRKAKISQKNELSD